VRDKVWNKREGGIRNKDKNPNQISRLNSQCSGGLRFKSRCEESLPCFSWFSWGLLSWCRNIMLPHPFPFRSFPISYSLMIPSFSAILKSSNTKQINKRQRVTMALHGILDTVWQNRKTWGSIFVAVKLRPFKWQSCSYSKKPSEIRHYLLHRTWPDRGHVYNVHCTDVHDARAVNM
jgi:hypothetical protein